MITLEYFGYGFGFAGLTLFMMQQIAPGKHQMAHYAFASGIMNLGVMLPGMISGFISDAIGYKWFFVFTLIATIPAYFGYNVKGGSLEVGRASTQAVVWTIVAIIIANLILTQMFLG